MGGNAGQLMPQLIILAVFVGLMYFILIKPQKKKDQEVQDMRSSIQVGDEIVTIGGICGKVVKTKEESIVIMVGADKTKFEIKRWAISTVEKKAVTKRTGTETPVEEKKIKPKRLGRKSESTESMEEELKALAETPDLPSETTVEEVVETQVSDAE